MSSEPNDSDIIQIRPLVKRNGLSLWVLSFILLIISLLLASVIGSKYPMLVVMSFGFNAVVGLIAWGKQRQPDNSFELTRAGMRYFHPKGSWFVAWQDIQRIDSPTVSHGIEQVTLPYVGIRLKPGKNKQLLFDISPRLASNLLISQRALLLNIESSCNTGECFSDGLIEKDTYVSHCGHSFNGIKAMFANRMERLHREMGYDLFIDNDQLDRPPEAFITLLRHCMQTVNQSRQRPEDD